MKKYLLFTKESIAEYYHVFQGDYETLGEAFRAAGRLAHNSDKLCLYRIISYVHGIPSRLNAEGFINPSALTTTIKESVAGPSGGIPSTIAPRSGYKTVGA